MGFIDKMKKAVKDTRYVSEKKAIITKEMSTHIDNFSSFLTKARKISKSIQPIFEAVTPAELFEILPKGEHRVSSITLMTIVLASKSGSKSADLFLRIIQSDDDILTTLFRMITSGNWPSTFNGQNLLVQTGRQDKLLISSTVGIIISLDKLNEFSSIKVSSPIISMFQVIKAFSTHTLDYNIN